jgi:light-independent protochlorophyllide reductase subunit B
MERHSAKRLGVPCAVISSPLHVQDVPARYSPQMGWEGANVIFDSWVHPLMMGLEEHLIGMFRHDFEFVDGHRSHLGEGAPTQTPEPQAQATPAQAATATSTATATLEGLVWSADGEAELAKIPFFVRSKVRRNTETYARERQLQVIDSETLYEAKAYLSR